MLFSFYLPLMLRLQAFKLEVNLNLKLSAIAEIYLLQLD